MNKKRIVKSFTGTDLAQLEDAVQAFLEGFGQATYITIAHFSWYVIQRFKEESFETTDSYEGMLIIEHDRSLMR